jgi:hypothetical protein
MLLSECDDEVNRMRLDCRMGRRWNVGPVKARLAVHLASMEGRGDQGLGTAGGDRSINAGELQDCERVAGCVLNGSVAVDGGHGEEIEVARCEKDRHSVVMPGIAVDNDLGSDPCHLLSSSSMNFRPSPRVAPRTDTIAAR